MKIAVYGTLRTDVGRSIRSPLMRELASCLGPCRIPGVLYHNGAFPMIIHGKGIVRGQLWDVPPVLEQEALRVLDMIESYDSKGYFSMYVRELVRLVEPDVDAHVYYWNLSLDRLRPIPSGDWKDVVHARRTTLA